MTLYIKYQYDDGEGNLIKAKNSKILVSVYLKKAGFINSTRNISQKEFSLLLTNEGGLPG